MEGSIFFRLMEKLEGFPTDMKVSDTFGKCLEYKVQGGYEKYKEERAIRFKEIWRRKGLSLIYQYSMSTYHMPSTVPSATHANIYKKLFLPLRLSQFSWEVRQVN